MEAKFTRTLSVDTFKDLGIGLAVPAKATDLNRSIQALDLGGQKPTGLDIAGSLTDIQNYQHKAPEGNNDNLNNIGQAPSLAELEADEWAIVPLNQPNQDLTLEQLESDGWAIISLEGTEEGIKNVQQNITEADAQELAKGLQDIGIIVPDLTLLLEAAKGDQQKAFESYMAALQAQVKNDKAKESKCTQLIRSFIDKKVEADPTNPTWRAFQAAIGQEGSLLSNLLSINNICSACGVAIAGVLIAIAFNPVTAAAGGTYFGAGAAGTLSRIIAVELVRHPSFGIIFYQISMSPALTKAALTAGSIVGGGAGYLVGSTVTCVTSTVSSAYTYFFGKNSKENENNA